jgi:hypothetical protein
LARTSTSPIDAFVDAVVGAATAGRPHISRLVVENRFVCSTHY